MKLELPNKIAICFVDGNHERTLDQMQQLNGIEDHFEVEWQLRSEMYPGFYHTYSQLINEAAIVTESEFMVFINPKTSISVDDVRKIINDLCNGFCVSMICSFGFWGTTKELFRHVGLMDERFIGSEYEDNDFGLRLKQFGKAINWRFVLEKYPWHGMNALPVNRGMTNTIYKTKWHKVNGVYYKNEAYLAEKRLPARLQKANRPEIMESWNDWHMSESDFISHVFVESNNAIIKGDVVKTHKVKSSSTLKFEYVDGKLEITFLSKEKTRIVMVFTNPEIGNEWNVLGNQIEINSNTHTRLLNELNPGMYDLRIFHEDGLVFNDSMFPVSTNPRILEFGLNVTVFDI